MWRPPGLRTGGAPSWQGLWRKAEAPWEKQKIMTRVKRNDWSTGRSSSSWNLNSSSTTSLPSSESRWFIAVTLLPWSASTAWLICLQNLSKQLPNGNHIFFKHPHPRQPKTTRNLGHDFFWIFFWYLNFLFDVSKTTTKSKEYIMLWAQIVKLPHGLMSVLGRKHE